MSEEKKAIKVNDKGKKKKKKETRNIRYISMERGEPFDWRKSVQ